MIFRPCTGECTDEGTHCEGCGRSHEEIGEMRVLVGSLIEFARKMDYENYQVFADAVAGNIKYVMGEGNN